MIKILWRRYWFGKLSRKNSPGRIPLTGDRALQNDFFSTVVTPQGSASILLRKAGKSAFVGKKLVEPQQHFLVPTRVSYQSLDGARLRINRYYKGHEFIYGSLLKMALFEWFKIPVLEVALEKTAQRLFNLRTPHRASKIEVLQEILRSDIEDSNGNPFSRGRGTTSSVSVLGRVYGRRLFRHPDYNKLYRYNELILDSLVADGALERGEGITYQIKGRALTLIAEYEEDNRRHRTSEVRNWTMVVLTLVIAMAAIAQAYLSQNP